MSYFYVICPVGADPDFRPKADIVRDLCEAYSLQAFFPLERRSELSIDQACSDMKRAAFVLADLSLERPSCYFELGIAETLGVRVFLIAASSRENA
jgi:hypothetical protein